LRDFERALRLDSRSKFNRWAAEDFSLAVAQMTLQSYYDELREQGTYRRTGMEGLGCEDHHLGSIWWESFSGAMTKTLNWLNIAFTSGRGLVREYQRQVDVLTDLLYGVRRLRQRLAREQTLDSIGAFDSFGPDFWLRRGVAQTTLEMEWRFWSTDFVHALKRQHLYSRFTDVEEDQSIPIPAMAEMGFDPRTEMLRLTTGDLFLRQVNLFNVLTIVGGPAIFAGIARAGNAARSTRLGTAIGTSLRGAGVSGGSVRAWLAGTVAARAFMRIPEALRIPTLVAAWEITEHGGIPAVWMLIQGMARRARSKLQLSNILRPSSTIAASAEFDDRG
jgi:hypothetical protein